MLSEEGVEYVVIGGMALILHGGSHVTYDCDIAIATDAANISALVKALGPVHPVPTGFEPGDPFVWDESVIKDRSVHLDTLAGSLDILLDTPGIDSFQGLLSRADRRLIGNHEVPVATIDDLIAMKSEAGRTKDLLHLEELRDLRRIEEGE